MNGTSDLTKGSILKKLLLFAIPLLGSSLIQQLYNTVDLIFVGNLLGREAAAAVGSSSLMVFCLLGVFNGLSIGAGVITAQAFGADDRVRLHSILHTSAFISLLGSVTVLLIGCLLAPFFLRLLNTPEDILELAVLYIRIYFLSLPFIVFYTMGAGILRAMGDSRTPMLYQLWGGLVNVAGNFIFLAVLGFGVEGAALATLFSQGLPACLVIIRLRHLHKDYHLTLSGLSCHYGMLIAILGIGIPAAVQGMGTTFSNLIVQSQINSLGVESIAAFTAYFKVENFIYLPIMAVGQAVAVFVGQNIGAGNVGRARQGIRDALWFGVGMTIFLSAMFLLLAEPVFSIFINDAEVIELGREIACVTFPCYFLYIFLEVFSASLRGVGQALPPMVIILSTMCGFRLVVLFIIMQVYPNVVGVAAVYPLTWLAADLCLYGWYRRRFPKAGSFVAAAAE